jgi:hypothetical protein
MIARTTDTRKSGYVGALRFKISPPGEKRFV